MEQSVRVRVPPSAPLDRRQGRSHGTVFFVGFTALGLIWELHCNKHSSGSLVGKDFGKKGIALGSANNVRRMEAAL